MAPGNNGRHPSHTGTIPKTKVRNNCNVPQEAVTPTRRDMTTNLVSTSLDWVPVSEYNSRSNYNHGQSRKTTNNTTNNSDQELTDLDNPGAFESGFGRFVPVRPQPRALPLNAQNRDILTDHQDDGASSSMTGHTLHPYAPQMQNGITQTHSNHTAAAVMIVNPTTPNAAGISQSFNAPNQNRNNLTRNLNPARNTFEGSAANNNAPATNSRTVTKTVNLMNNMYEGQGSFNNINDNNHVHRESARALGEAIVAACPDSASVERRLGQIREYIRVTSSLVDTMRNSEDEAFIEHTKEEYDDLVKMVMQLKDSETNLEQILTERKPDNIEVPAEEANATQAGPSVEITEVLDNSANNDASQINNLKKVTNIENEQINKQHKNQDDPTDALTSEISPTTLTENNTAAANSTTVDEKKGDEQLNQLLKKNIQSCKEKVAQIEQLKKAKDSLTDEQQDVTRPVSVQSNGSAYSDNDLWQNEIKSKMEMSQMRLTALKQQQKRLIKYQQEAKQQLEEMNKERQTQETAGPSTSHAHDNFTDIHNHQPHSNYSLPRMYAANQIGVATTLPQSTEALHQTSENEQSSRHSQDERFRENAASGEEAAGGGAHSSGEEDNAELAARGQLLQVKLRELQLKKQHMENLVTEFQKLQAAARAGSTRNTYSSSNEESADDEPQRKCNKASGSNIKNEDPFKLMEIKAIKTALQKTKDLMRSVENYEADHLSGGQEDNFREMSSAHSNINDNKSEGGGSLGGWSDGSVCRVRNSLPQRHKYTNEQQDAQHSQHSQHHTQIQHSHEDNIASLQEMAQELRMETEKILNERDRIMSMISNSNKEASRKKKMNEEVRPSHSGAPGPTERRQMQLRAILAEKQRELESLINKENILCSTRDQEPQNTNAESQSTSVINHSYNSEQEELNQGQDQLLLDSQNSRDVESYRASGDNVIGPRPMASLPAHITEISYGSDTDSGSRNKNLRNRPRRRQTQDRQSDESSMAQSNNASHNHNARHEPRGEVSNVNMVPPVAQNVESPGNLPYPHPPAPFWNNKSNQDMRTNQFTQNSHSQTMERLLGTPQMTYPPSMPFNMMMPYGMVGGCGCGCGLWGSWCWQQLVMQQREIHQLRDQLNHLEERWRVDTASHTLNNQVPPGNRANNYWDNFRSYSRQNLLSANNKANADGHLGPGTSQHPHPLVDRSHNPLHRTASVSSPCVTPKRNTNPATHNGLAQNGDAPSRRTRNVAYERSLSFSSAPDVLNVNQYSENDASTSSHSRNVDEAANVPNVNLNREEPTTNPFRHLKITNPIPEIIQAHSNNLNSTSKKKSSSKLPAKNSRRNYSLEYSQTSNINIASASETPNHNLASTSRDDKATSKLFDLLRENVYSEVTVLIGVNESHPDFLIQLFRELQQISSDALRQRVLHSIRSILSQYGSILDSQPQEGFEEERAEAVSTTSDIDPYGHPPGSSANTTLEHTLIRFLLVKSDEFCTPELLESLAAQILAGRSDRNLQPAKRRLLELLAKYEGIRVSQIMGDFIENLPLFTSSVEEESERAEAALQDVAGSLNLFTSDGQHTGACAYELWAAAAEAEGEGDSARSSQDGQEAANGDLAEADQTCPEDEGTLDEAGPEALPDVVDTDEVTPTEAEAEWLGLDCVPTRLHMEDTSEKQKGDVRISVNMLQTLKPSRKTAV